MQRQGSIALATSRKAPRPCLCKCIRVQSHKRYGSGFRRTSPLKKSRLRADKLHVSSPSQSELKGEDNAGMQCIPTWPGVTLQCMTHGKHQCCKSGGALAMGARLLPSGCSSKPAPDASVASR